MARLSAITSVPRYPARPTRTSKHEGGREGGRGMLTGQKTIGAFCCEYDRALHEHGFLYVCNFKNR